MLKPGSLLAVALLGMLQCGVLSFRVSAATAVVFANGNQFAPGSISTSRVDAMRASGFNTVVLFTMTIHADGNFTYNDGVPVCSNGVYTGGADWAAKLAQCKVAPTGVTRIEMSIAGWGDPSFANIKNRILADGTGTNTILYRNLLALKSGLGIDAVCYDDESTYDATSSIQFGNMCGAVGLKVSLCPYTQSGYWSAVKAGLGGTCDAIYLQCYEGGAGNNPATWNNDFGGQKVIPGYWDWERDTTFLTKMQDWSAAGGPGGFLWPSCTGCNPPAGAAELLEYAGWILDTFKTLDLQVTPASGFDGVAAFGSECIPMGTEFTLSNTTATAIDWAVMNTSGWLTVSAPAGTLAGGASVTTAVGLNEMVATNLAPGLYAATVLFSNRTSAVSVSRHFTLNTAIANWPVSVTGWNAALLAPNTATPANPGATAFDIPNNYCFYQSGLSGSARGLPGSGAFPSQADTDTAFRLGAYGDMNALLLGSSHPEAGTLTLSTPRAFNSLALLACSANGGGQGTFVVHFNDGSQSPVFHYNAQDWFGTVSNVAIQGFGRLRLGTPFSIEDAGDANPNLYQTTVDLAALGLTRPVTSITVTNPTGAGPQQTTAVLAVSGTPADLTVQPPTGLKAVPGTNGTVRLTWNTSAGATNYVVQRSPVGGGPYDPVQTVATTGCIDSGLMNGSTYFYVVAAIGSSNTSSNCAEVQVMPGSYRGWLFAVDPVAYWPLDETAGSTAHEEVGGKTGQHMGGCLVGYAGVVGDGFIPLHRAVRYLGTSGYTVLPRLIGEADFSLAFWVRTSAVGGTPNWYDGKGLIDGEVGGAADDFGVCLVGNKVGFGVGNPDLTLTSDRSINNNAWHQVVVTRHSGTGAMRIYIDGTVDASATGPTGPRTAPPNLRIGGIQTGGNYLSGIISDVAFFDQVLTADQIATLYSAATGLFYDVELEARRSGTMLTLAWPGNGRLLDATNVFGPWTTNVATSPVIVPATWRQRFFRLQVR